MTLHAATEYIMYRWAAKTRHGVHSPFVYTFIDHIIRGKKDAPPLAALGAYKVPSAKYTALLQAIAAYYGYKIFTVLPAPGGEELALPADMLLLDGGSPQEWVGMLNGHLHIIKNSSMAVAANIHADVLHSRKWRRLCRHPRVRLSIDLYGIGLLFFRDDFKERQHFVLRY